MHGFPQTGPAYLEGQVVTAPQENLQYQDHKRNRAVSDTVNYLVKSTGEVQGGYSGAPVFLKRKTGEWFFGGVVSQGVPGDNYFFIVKPLLLMPML